MQCPQEHLKTIVYAKFGGQRKCIMGNLKIENDQVKWLCACVMCWPHRLGVHSRHQSLGSTWVGVMVCHLAFLLLRTFALTVCGQRYCAGNATVICHALLRALVKLRF